MKKAKQKRFVMPAWFVGWTPKAAKEWENETDPPMAFQPIGADADVQFKVPCRCHKDRWHYGSVLAVFETEAEARAWREAADFDIPDFQVFPGILRLNGACKQ